MSSNRSVPPAVLSHPSIVALIERGAPAGSVTAEEVRQAFGAADVAPAHLKSLMAHLAGLGISVESGCTARPARGRCRGAEDGHLHGQHGQEGRRAGEEGCCRRARREEGGSGEEGRARQEGRGDGDRRGARGGP
ncbi:hypothetical protein G5V59_00785 [Nocardioides sp. W3-2-3]|nr:hypothetical protein [Nocardioides convexus]